jgi:hypothetical protein
MCVCVCVCKRQLHNYLHAIPSFRSNELSSVNTYHARDLCTVVGHGQKISLFFSVYRAYSASIDNILF